MSKLFMVFKFELLRTFRRRSYLFTTFVIPVLAVLLVLGIRAYQDWQASRPPADTPAVEEEDSKIEKIGYVDQSGIFGEPGLFGVGGTLTYYATEDEARAAMNAGDVDTVYVIAEDYIETGAITRYAENFSISSMAADSIFRSFLMNTLLKGVDRNLVTRLDSDILVQEHQVSTEDGATVVKDEDASFVLVYVFALLLGISTFFGAGYLMQNVLEEKETRMVEIILSTIRPLPLLAAKVLAAGLLGFFQILCWAAAAIFVLQRLGTLTPALANINVPPMMLVWCLLYFVFAYLMYGGAYAAIGALSPSMKEGPQMAVIVTLPAMLPIYFTTLFAETPNAGIPVLLSLFPITAPMGMIQRLSVGEVPLGEILLSLALVAVTAFGMIWLAGRLFRVNTLLAGQMPKLRDLGRIVRES